MQGMQPTPSPISDQGHSHSHGLNQSPGQGQSRPLSPTPTAGLASRDRVRNAWAGLRDRLGLRPSSPTSSPSSPLPAMSSSPEPEPAALSPSSPTTPVDPRTQLLADMARAFQMGMGLDDTPGSGARSGGAQSSSPAIEVSLSEGQQRQQQQAQQQQERPPPPEDSFERFLMDLQVDLRRTLEAEPEVADREPDRGLDVEPSAVNDTLPLVYPQESPASADVDIDFSEGLPALPPDNDDELLSDDELDADDEDEELEEETAVPPSQPPAPLASQTPRRTVAGSERRPGGGINWWRMYRFPPMIVPHASGAPPGSSAHSPTSPSSPPIPPATPSATTTGDAPLQGAQAQDGNTVVPVIVVGLQSVHGHGGHTHRHAEEHPPLPPPLLPPQDQIQGDNEHALQDDVAGEVGAESPRERRWSTRAADALRGFRPPPPPGTGTARHEGPGSGAGESAAARAAGDDGHGSTTFFIYVIGGTFPPEHPLFFLLC
jgi:hypothetical protein